MAKLKYLCLASLDGYVADAAGDFQWAAPNEAVHAFVNDLSRPIGTQLLGRTTYEVMQVWDTWDTTGEPAVIADFQALWKACDKVVYSTTLDAVTTQHARLERTFDPAAVEAMKASSEHDLAVGGPGLAEHALRAGLVDELQLILSPVVIGDGLAALPKGLGLDLALTAQRGFEGGAVSLQYDVRGRR